MKIILSLILLFICANSFAASRTFDRTWLGVFGKKKIGDTRFFVWTEGQMRMDNDYFTKQQMLLRNGVLMKIDDKNEIGLLYTYVETDGAPDEHRPTFQYIHSFFKTEVHGLSIRNRFEYRKREGINTSSGRYRGQVRYQHFLESKKSWIVWDEPFLNISHEDWTGKRLIERNRAFIGLGLPFYDTNLEIGYMNQYTPRNNRSTSEHVLVLYYFF
jgi:hypothetical protein